MPDDKSTDTALNIRKSLDMSRYADIIGAARSPASEALRHLYENPGIERMLESIRAGDAVIRAALGPLDEIQRQHNSLIRTYLGPLDDLRRASIFDIGSPLQHKIEAAQQALASYTDRFHLPAATEMARLLNQLPMDPFRDVLARYAQDESAVRRAMESMQTPWLDMQETLRSIEGFAELQSIGSAVQRMPSFDENLSAALRVGLGDWRDTITWPTAIFTDLIARSDFYRNLGFNPALTDFPAPAFEQSLDIAELRRDPPTLIKLYGAPVESSDDDAEEEGLARTNVAHDWLLRLETQLRSFIEETMMQAFGADWHKRRLPNGLYEQWQEKKLKAQQAGDRDWPLIAYADFTDYERVICRGDNWREVFAVFFMRIESVRESLQRLYPIRLDTMHARPITQDDELLLFVETRRLVRAIGRSKTSGTKN